MLKMVPGRPMYASSLGQLITPPPKGDAVAVASWTNATGPGARDIVILLEDNEVIAGLIGTVLLQRLGLRVVWSPTAGGGLQEFERYTERLAVVVADCRLPDGDGRVACQQMRALQPELPVLLTSGRFSADNYSPLEPGRFVQFLPKPYSPAEMAARVRSILVDAGRDGRPVAAAGFV